MRDHQSPLAAALVDVNATLTELLAAADEQYVAVVERDRPRLEGVTRQQERLSARLERAERKRLAALDGRPIAEAIASEPELASLNQVIAASVQQLQTKHAQTNSLIEKTAELNAQTIQFLQRLVGVSVPAYGARGAGDGSRHSLLLDGRA
jgi:flagellar biosynthesis/type III secretory pathway chaperone